MANVKTPEHPSHASAKQVYSEIVDFLSSSPGDPDALLELDILPSNIDLPAFVKSRTLRDGPSLAVGKKDLAAAFIIGCKILFPSPGKAASPSTLSAEESYEVFKATGVILFFDTEHLTAANFRKRYLLDVARREGDDYIYGNRSPRHLASDRLYIEISQELRVISSLLTSPLKRHSKSPTLFYHLLWIWKTFNWTLDHLKLPLFSANDDASALAGQKSFRAWLLLKQHKVVGLRAADRHFANYYAFQYLRRMVELVELVGTEALHMKDWQKLVDMVHYWCLRNPRDISGWSYMVFLLGRPEVKLTGNQAQILSSVNEWKSKYSDWGRDEAVNWFEKIMHVTITK